jgi:putative phosphoesterase
MRNAKKATRLWEVCEIRSMVKIGLLSDTHGWLDPRVFHHFAEVDEIWHAGDFGEGVLEALQDFKPLRGVWGNIDGHTVRAQTPEHLRFRIEEVDVWMTHIAGLPGKWAKPIAADIAANPPTLLVCGHSHICKVQYDKRLGTLYMNPGAAGRHGFHHQRTLLRFEIAGSKIQQLEVVELGPRAERFAP